MIFPGMDPYLEDPRIWPGVHASLIVYSRDFLQPVLRPRYVAAIEERVYLQGPEIERIPDVSIRRQRRKAKGGVAVLEADEPVVVTVPWGEIHETYITILDMHADQKLVTVIEMVSPSNKYAGPGRDSYRAEQKEVLQSDVHLVEIDLLRTGPHVLAVVECVARTTGPYHYLASVNRAKDERSKFDLYPRSLPERLPRISVPLAGEDPDIVLDVQALLERTYEQGCYQDRIAYDKPCRPPLSEEDRRWANRVLKDGKTRSSPGNGKTRSRKKG